jgi:uncharacterized membrane protein YvbJ
MKATTCSKCGHEMPDQVWGCPHCGNSTEAGGEEREKAISTKGMTVLLLLFVLFPVLLFLIHIFVPGI